MRFRSHAPVRTADLGGWTDTWFAKTGLVCSVAVEPGIAIDFTLEKGALRGATNTGLSRLTEVKRTGGATVLYDLSSPVLPGSDAAGAATDADLFLQALLLRVMPPRDLRLRIRAGVPAGSGLGTSASLAVAMLAGLHALHQRFPSAAELATQAHEVETSLGLQSGIQDQLAAAFGGVKLYEIDYPTLRSEPKEIPLDRIWVLRDRLLTVYLGSPHQSSAVHDEVIANLQTRRPSDKEKLLLPLRAAATAGFAALLKSNLDAYGAAMRANSSAQRGLHPSLVSEVAEAVIMVARARGARGWKVNGAGGEGGSMSIVGPSKPDQHALLIQALNAIPGVSVLKLNIAQKGVSVVPL